VNKIIFYWWKILQRFFVDQSIFKETRQCKTLKEKKLNYMYQENGNHSLKLIHNNSTETQNIITAKDHASVQLNVGLVDSTGRYTGKFKTACLCGEIRKNGKGDGAINRFALKAKLMKDH
jgi:small subunit ribosomal protein S21e